MGLHLVFTGDVRGAGRDVYVQGLPAGDVCLDLRGDRVQLVRDRKYLADEQGPGVRRVQGGRVFCGECVERVHVLPGGERLRAERIDWVRCVPDGHVLG